MDDSFFHFATPLIPGPILVHLLCFRSVDYKLTPK